MAVLIFGMAIGALAASVVYHRLFTLERRNGPQGLKRRKAQKHLRRIWRDQHPGCLTIEEAFRVPEPWKWFNIYANLQNKNETLECAATAFAETLDRIRKEKHHLADRIAAQRKEVTRLKAAHEALRAQNTGTTA